MSAYATAQGQLQQQPKTWLVTGVAGFIGSNLLETLLKLGQTVVGLDNFATGHRRNLQAVESAVGSRWQQFTFYEGDIRDIEDCQKACKGVDYVLHQAALGSVPRSIADPLLTNSANIDGFLNMLVAARDNQVKRFVYAASSSTYGDHQALPKVEDTIGSPLSPYAVTKYVNELYAKVFASAYDIETIGLRYFNVFGQRQDPNGAYAAVIPRWFGNLLSDTTCQINGDGETSRDFCFIDNTVQANLLAATSKNPDALNQVFNVAFGERTTLNELFQTIQALVGEHQPDTHRLSPEYTNFRPGDVRHSLADISKANALLGYSPSHSVKQGLTETAEWFIKAHSTESTFEPIVTS